MPPIRRPRRRPSAAQRRTGRRTFVFDTGPLVAVHNEPDEHHQWCQDWMQTLREDLDTLVVPTVVLTEVTYLINKKYGIDAEARFVDQFAVDVAEGYWTLHEPTPPELARVADILRSYRGHDLGFVDAAVIATAESRGTMYVASVENRYLPHVQPIHADYLTFFPPR